MPAASDCGPYDDRLEQRLTALKAEFPRGSGIDFRLSLMRELGENTSLTLSAARDQAEAFLRRKGYEIPPEPPVMVLLAIGMLGVMAAVFVAPIFTSAVGGLLVVTGHTHMAARYWPALMAGSGAGVWAIVTLWCGPPMWKNYRQSLNARASNR